MLAEDHTMLRIALALFLLVTPGSAQGRTLVVDAGGGGQFTDIASAEAAAQPGDTLLVRRGTYGPFATQKGIAVVGDSAAPAGIVIQDSWTNIGSTMVRVSGVPATARFALSNVRLVFQGYQRGMEIDGNAGAVLVSDCVFQVQLCFQCGGGPQHPGITVSRSARVHVSGSTVVGVPALTVDSSTLTVVGSFVLGGVSADPAHPCCGGPGIRATASTVVIARTTVIGSDGHGHILFVRPQPGIAITGGELHLHGNSTDAVRAGSNMILGQPRLPASGIVGTSTRLELDPLFVVASTDGALPIDCPGCPVVTRRRLALRAADGRIGGGLAGNLASRPGDLFAMLADTPRTPVPTPFGQLHVDPTASIWSVLLLQQPGGVTAFALPVPAVPELLGTWIALQAVGFDSVLAQPDLSNAAVVLLR